MVLESSARIPIVAARPQPPLSRPPTTRAKTRLRLSPRAATGSSRDGRLDVQPCGLGSRPTRTQDGLALAYLMARAVLPNSRLESQSSAGVVAEVRSETPGRGH